MNAPLVEQLELLARLRSKDLDIEWRRTMRSVPPQVSADLKRRAIAYRLQEKLSGGLPCAIARRLRTMTTATDEHGPCSAGCPPKPGTRFVREWNGQTLVVTATDDGYALGSQTYRSLSAIAREVTGTRWSGPKFFGLTNG